MNDENERFSFTRTLHFAHQSAVGLNTLHTWSPTVRSAAGSVPWIDLSFFLSLQVLHRDLKSLNFLVDENDVVKICDFGLSREEVDSNKSTLAKMRGTFAYTAPECACLRVAILR